MAYVIEFVNSRKEASEWGTGKYRPGIEVVDTLDQAYDLATATLADNVHGYDYADILTSQRHTRPIASIDHTGIYERHYRDNGLPSHREKIAERWYESGWFDTSYPEMTRKIIGIELRYR